MPGDPAAPVELTRGIVLFVVIRALAVAGSAAIAFGLKEPNADWMPIATIVAIKPSLEQAGLVSTQRVVGAAIGALVAILVLLLVSDKDALKWIVMALASIGVAIQGLNYALYAAVTASGALVAVDITHPTNYGSEGRRVLFTLIGVAIGVLVTFIADRLQKHAAQSAPDAPVPASPAAS